MTPTIIFWVRICILLLLAYTVISHLWNARKRGYLIPRQRSDWKPLLNDSFTLLAGGFALFMLERNYQAPVDAVLVDGGSDIAQLSYLDIGTGQTHQLADLHEKVVILNIWATWCPPCRRELPDLSQVQQRFGTDRLAVIAVSDEDAATVSNYVKDKGFAFSTGVFTQMPASISRVGTRPVSILIDQTGRVRDMVVGARGTDFFSNWVESLR
ncbi:MAG: TlpA family protein disulfide reductase [bacterium]